MTEPNRCERCGGPLQQESPLGETCPNCTLKLDSAAREEFDHPVLVSPQSVDPTPAARPTVLGRYRILRLIGEGGMGAVVYEAEQDNPRRSVAIKIIKPGMSSPKLLRRFEQESEALGRLQHPGIAQIYEAGSADTGLGPQPYFAMEFIRGTTLKDYAEAHHLSTRQRLELIAKVADAVQHAHQRGLIHRDLKPANILVDQTGQPKILDFGVARATDSDMQATRQTDVGQLLGTLAYMSPEQALADPLELDTRSDVYALGVILYELLAGRMPYTLGRTIQKSIQAIREEDPARLSAVSRSYRGDIETIVAKALEKDKERRYGSAAELALDISRYLHDEPIVARPPSASYQLQKLARRHKALVAGFAAVLLVLIGGIVVSAWQATRARRAETAATLERDQADAAREAATKQRDLALTAEQRSESERNRAVAAEERALREAETVKRQRLRFISQVLANASLRDSENRFDNDYDALLARQAMLFQAGAVDQSFSVIENALQKAARPALWSHNLLPKGETQIVSVAFSPDGAYFAAGGEDGNLRVWDLSRADARAPILLQVNQLRFVAFSHDSKYLASGGAGPIKIWQVRNLAAPPVLLQGRYGNSFVWSGAFSPNGTRLVSGGSDGVVLWDLQNPGSQLTLRQIPQIPVFAVDVNDTNLVSPGSVTSVAFSADGARLAAANRAQVGVWDLRNPEALPAARWLPGPQVLLIALSPDGARLAVTTTDGVLLLDGRDPNLPGSVMIPDSRNVVAMAFSPDSARLALGGSTLQLCDLRNRTIPPVLLTGHHGHIRAVAFSPDGGRLASASGDRTLQLWELRNASGAAVLLPSQVAASPRLSPESNKVEPRPSLRLSVAFSPDGARLASSLFAQPNISTPFSALRGIASAPLQDASSPLQDGIIRIWDPRDPITSPRLLPGGGKVTFSLDGMRIASKAYNQAPRVWDLRDLSAVAPWLPQGPSEVGAGAAIALAPDGYRLAVAGNNVLIWDLRNPLAPPLPLQDSKMTDSVRSVAFSPDGSRLAVGSGDVRVWDLRNPGASPIVHHPRRPQQIPQLILDVAFSPDGGRLAFVSGLEVWLWNLRDTTYQLALQEDPTGNSGISSVAFSPDGRRLAVSGGFGIRLLDLWNPGTPPVLFPAPVRSPDGRPGVNTWSVAFSPDGLRLASGGSDGIVRLWPLWSAAADYLCTRVWRNLSMDEWRLHVGEDIPYERTCPALPAGPGVPGVPH